MSRWRTVSLENSVQITIIGTGATGNNTELFVHPYAGGVLDYSLNADIVNLDAGDWEIGRSPSI